MAGLLQHQMKGSSILLSALVGRRGGIRSTRAKSVFRTLKNGSHHLGCGCGVQVRSIGTTAVTSKDVGSALPVDLEGAPVNVLEYIESVQQTGKIAVLFSDSPPVLWTVDLLCFLKDLPGMSWIGVIICGTLIIRTFVGLPVSIVQQRALIRLENLKPELKKLGEELKRETGMAVRKFNWDEKTARVQFTKSYKKHWRRMVEENKCHPMRSLALTLTQLPFWICFSSALRNVVYAVPLPRTPEMTERWVQIHNEGTPWIESLVLADPLVFPVVFFAANLLNIELNRRQRLLKAVPETKFQKAFPWILRGGIVVITYFAVSVPSAVSMYWATSSSLALAQNLFLSGKTAKRLFKLAPVSPTNPVPPITNKNL